MGTGVSPKRIATSSSYPVFETVKSAASSVFCFLCLCLFCRSLITKQWNPFFTCSSLERRWSSRTFRYGYLVTTSPQLSVPPSAAPSLRLGHWLRALPTPMVWRAVCTRPGNVFTATFWFAITSDSSFVQSSCRLQSELRRYFWDLLHLAALPPFVYAIVARV